MAASYYWHDYETWGAVPAHDRPCQFAGLRTDTDLNPVGEPLVLFSRPADDLLPMPDACLITGITPQQADREGIPEAEFAVAIQRQLAVPGTCGVGYNSLRFDDEVTRHLFYRNLLDPYAHAHRNGNSRWDLIDALRLAHALRPGGIQWPEREPGVASFRLEDLSAANDIAHAAHDALADVRATIGMARLLRRAQPRLFDYVLTLRDIETVRRLLAKGEPLLHVSQRYPAAQGSIAAVAIVGRHPRNPKQLFCFDLRQDPGLLLDLSAEQIRERLFTPTADLPEGMARIPLKGIKINASPVLSPLATLDDAAAERWDIDRDRIARHAARIAEAKGLIADKLREVYQGRRCPVAADPERMLYTGAFFTDADRRAMEAVHRRPARELVGYQPRFEDPRLPILLFRMRARSWPETLTDSERADWDAWRLERLTDPDAGGAVTIGVFEHRLAELRTEHARQPARIEIIEQLEQWARRVMDAGG